MSVFLGILVIETHNGTTALTPGITVQQKQKRTGSLKRRASKEFLCLQTAPTSVENSEHTRLDLGKHNKQLISMCKTPPKTKITNKNASHEGIVYYQCSFF